MAELTGPEHVGISLDYASVQEANVGMMVKDASHYWPAGSGYDRSSTCLDVRRLPEVAEALADAGFDADGIVAVLGGNFRRVAEQVWR